MSNLKFVAKKIHKIQKENNDNWEKTAVELRKIEKRIHEVLEYIKECRKIYETYTEKELKEMFEEVIQ